MIIAIISLGCDKNRVDTERMLYNLNSGGHTITNEYDKAEIIIINTCAFINSARKEAIDTILQYAQYKQTGALKKLIVTGCLSQKYASQIKDDLPEVDVFLGVNAYDTINDVIKANDKIINVNCTENFNNTNRIITTPLHYAYLKIADGCNNHCTYCTIPSIRGKYISRSLASLIAEAQKLADEGVSEIILVAQDVTSYGLDIDATLPELLKQLTSIEKLQTIRLMYCYPEKITDELIEYIKANDKISKYIDVPLQHVSDNVLKKMGRKSTNASICALMQKLKQADITVRTTFMSGFSGETDLDHNLLCDFIKEQKLTHIGFFSYSLESDTPSYKILPRISAKVKRQRLKQLIQIQQQNVLKHNNALIGKTIKVVYENIDYSKSLFVGRALTSAPEIDNVVYFKADYADVGKTYDVLITGVLGYDLLGAKI